MQVLHQITPILTSQKLTNLYGKNFYFKIDALQPSGSFKIRGIGKLCQHYKDEGCKKFISSSGGNAGIAAAYAGMKLNTPTTVFVPKTSNKLYVDQIASYGATINIIGNNWDEAHDAALNYLGEQPEGKYIPPFDHPMLWDGHASIIDECVNQMIKPDVVVVAVGGGGLACGILQGLHRNNWHDVPLITSETIGADCFYQAEAAKQLITLPDITSKATSLGAKTVCKQLFEWTQNHKIYPYRVSDETAAHASREFAIDKRILTELSAGAALSMAYNHADIIKHYNNILIIVCGGVNTDFLLK